MKIFLLETIHADAHALLEGIGEVELASSIDPEYLAGAIAGADAALTRGRGRMPRTVLAAGTKLKCVARCGVGTDNIDLAAATELGIPVVFAPGSTTMAVAEHAVMLMLGVARRIARFDRETKSGNWAFRNSAGMTTELRGKTLGILGLGDIGRRIGELGQAFGMDIIYWSRNSNDSRFRFVSKEELYRDSDVISVSLALNDETRGLVGRDAFAAMKPGAILINTARGEVIDEQELVKALSEGRLAGAGIDVIQDEVHPEHNPLWQLDNVLVTPHVAAITDVTYRDMCLTTATEVANILKGTEPTERLIRNPKVILNRRR